MSDALTLGEIREFVVEQWRENPLARRMIWRTRKVLLIVVAAQVVVTLFSSVVLRALYSSMGAMTSMMLVSFVSYTVTLGVWLVQAMGPIVYADWVYKKIWAEDESLRLTRFTFRDWLGAMLLPMVALIAIYYATRLVILPFVALVQAVSIAENLRAWYLLQTLLALPQIIASMLVLTFLAMSVVIRRLVQRHGSQSDRKNMAAIFLPYLIAIGYFLVTYTCMGATWTYRSPGAMDLETMAILSGLEGIKLLLVCLVFLAFRILWRRDLEMARERLFRTED